MKPAVQIWMTLLKNNSFFLASIYLRMGPFLILLTIAFFIYSQINLQTFEK